MTYVCARVSPLHLSIRGCFVLRSIQGSAATPVRSAQPADGTKPSAGAITSAVVADHRNCSNAFGTTSNPDAATSKFPTLFVLAVAAVVLLSIFLISTLVAVYVVRRRTLTMTQMVKPTRGLHLLTCSFQPVRKASAFIPCTVPLACVFVRLLSEIPSFSLIHPSALLLC